MLSEIRATTEAFGHAFLADYLSVIEMNMLRNCLCVPAAEQPRSTLLQGITACKKAVESIRQQHKTIDAGLHAMDALYSENKGWDDRVSAFIADMNDKHDPEDVLALFNYDEDFASGFADDSGFTPFMWACYNGHLQLVQEMLPFARLSDTLFEDGQTALLMAIEGGHTDIVIELIANGADICQGRKDGYTPFMAAAEFGHTDLVKTILWHAEYEMDNEGVTEYVNRSGGGGCNDKKKSWSQTALMWAMGGHHTSTARVIAENAFCNARTVVESGYNALMVAASSNQDDQGLFSTLLYDTVALEQETTTPHIVNLCNQRYSLTGYTALLHACENANSQMVEELLNNGADPNHGATLVQKKRFTYTPLMAADGHYEITRLLLKAGADVRREFKLHDGQIKRALDFAEDTDGHDLIELAENLYAMAANIPSLPRSRSSSIGDVSDDDMPALIRVC